MNEAKFNFLSQITNKAPFITATSRPRIHLCQCNSRSSSLLGPQSIRTIPI